MMGAGREASGDVMSDRLDRICCAAGYGYAPGRDKLWAAEML